MYERNFAGNFEEDKGEEMKDCKTCVFNKYMGLYDKCRCMFCLSNPDVISSSDSCKHLNIKELRSKINKYYPTKSDK